jgi:hypothetical protein
MFNQYLWDNYLKAGGNEIVDLFKTNLSKNYTNDYAAQIVKLHHYYCPMSNVTDDISRQLLWLKDDLKNGTLLDKGEYTVKSALDVVYSALDDGENNGWQYIFSLFCNNLELFSTQLAIERPDLFVPYYFQYNFNVLMKISQEFGIDLPPVPMKRNYEERFYYYGNVCTAFTDFRKRYHLSLYEFCAFLYDFAVKYIGGMNSYIIKDLPEPRSAFFIGGSKSDKFLEENSDTITCWQCNPKTEAGDMIVMYLRTPVSAVDSVWRSVSDGFNDPLFYYYRCTYISNPVRIKRITQKQLKQDCIFGNLSVVRKNMQGINGVELLPSQYNYLMDLADSDVKRLVYTVTKSGLELTNEKDVEDKLIKPLLNKLDYNNNQFEQQLRIEIGNHNKIIIPDFLILPIKTIGHQSAFALIEAKYYIPSTSQFEQVKIQARSYARQVLAQYSIIASKDHIWIFSIDDDFTDDIFMSSWDELSNPDTFSMLYKLIGNQHRKGASTVTPYLNPTVN